MSTTAKTGNVSTRQRRLRMTSSFKRRREPTEDSSVESISSLLEAEAQQEEQRNTNRPKVYSQVRIRPLPPFTETRRNKVDEDDNDVSSIHNLPMTLGRVNMSTWWWSSCVVCSKSNNYQESQEPRKSRNWKHWAPSSFCSEHCRPLAKEVICLSKAMINITVRGELKIVGRKPDLVHVEYCNWENNIMSTHQEVQSSFSNGASGSCTIVSIGEFGRRPWIRFHLEMIPESIPGEEDSDFYKPADSNARPGRHKRKHQPSLPSPRSKKTKRFQKPPTHISTRLLPQSMPLPLPPTKKETAVTKSEWLKRIEKPMLRINESKPCVDKRKRPLAWSRFSVLSPDSSQWFHPTIRPATKSRADQSENSRKRPRVLQFSQEELQGDTSTTKKDTSPQSTFCDKPHTQVHSSPKPNHRSDSPTIVSKEHSPKSVVPFPNSFVLPITTHSSTSCTPQGDCTMGCKRQPRLRDHAARKEYRDSSQSAAGTATCSILSQPCSGDYVAMKENEDCAQSSGSSEASSILSLPGCEKLLSTQTSVVVLGSGLSPHLVLDRNTLMKYGPTGAGKMASLGNIQRTAPSKTTKALLDMILERNRGTEAQGSFGFQPFLMTGMGIVLCSFHFCDH